ncbi:tripartite tricarboxylate transporter TctB family protein [Falsiroseomonas tokyonensis]|uniref:Tripartite tricarboxylate transporter TctB family protein n=1 Tax=Falsiroseomonas tokyonensis TaxID=430521 RepID=A0ABV7BT74_9PROT|nr:tripartite tricarboxylate transporter TctB family protein [Falsiroseomonas tokyonensis]MBU8537292.1 tripartite tricarboxylate transporter TctB family protein [Falsiroseomonas tokyonensis]
MSGGSDQAPLSPRADLYVAAVLLALGLGVMALAWRMPTFVEQSGTGLTAPGIVPGFHATVVAVLAVLLGLRAIRQGALKAGTQRAGGGGGADAWRLAIAATLGVLYAGVLVGRLPFWLATALFVFSFTAAFEWSVGPARRVRRLAEAALLGLATGGIVTLVFERIFLVRLP